jgi:hypothetical protein
MKKIILILVLIISSITYSFTKEDLGIGVGMSTGGYQLKGIYTFNDFFSSSLEYNNFTLNNFTTGDLTGTLKISSLKLNGHFHPFAGGFRLTAGYAYNLSDINFTMTNIQYDYGGASPATMSGTVNTDFGKYLPYLGVGWGYQYGDFSQFRLGNWSTIYKKNIRC